MNFTEDADILYNSAFANMQQINNDAHRHIFFLQCLLQPAARHGNICKFCIYYNITQ